MSKKQQQTNNTKPVVAICYDFDKTLSPKDMQVYSVFPKLGITDETQVKAFWDESNRIAKSNGMCMILSYMRLVLQKAEGLEDVSLKESDFVTMGKDIELFPGVEGWFDRINNYGKELGLEIEHYIISAGLKEIIEGTPIAKHFKEIFASCYYYNNYGVPKWPRQVVNYTQKTQYLFRINKDCLDLSDERSINEILPDEKRRVPFKNFIYIGDSDTDIPAMKLVYVNGGKSIGVYNPETTSAKVSFDLHKGKRIHFFAPADYRADKGLDAYVKSVLSQIKASEELARINYKQNEVIDFISNFTSLYDNMKEFVERSDDIQDISRFEGFLIHYLKDTKSKIKKNYHGESLKPDDILKIITEKELEIKKILEAKRLKLTN